MTGVFRRYRLRDVLDLYKSFLCALPPIDKEGDQSVLRSELSSGSFEVQFSIDCLCESKSVFDLASLYGSSHQISVFDEQDGCR